MIHFKFDKNDLRFMYLTCDDDNDRIWIEPHRINKDIHPNLINHMNLIDPLCFRPTYTGAPYTQDFLFTYRQASGNIVYYCALGLWQEVYKFFKKYDVPFDGLVENKDIFKSPLKHTFEEFKDIVDGWRLSLDPRPYQYEAAYKILQWRQSASELATRAGKTLIAYMVFRYSMEYLGMKKILAIVPSIDLVKQMYEDFNNYAEFFNTECVWSGGKLVESANMTVGTFQSLIKFLDRTNKKYDPHFFDGYDCVFVDEMHRASAAQIKQIISQPFFRNLKIAFGLTGTLPKEHTIEHYCVHAELGATIQKIKPKELMDQGYISEIYIEQHRLNYTDTKLQQSLYIRCAEYALGEYVMTKNPKNGHNEKTPLPDPQFLIRHVKQLPMGIADSKAEIYSRAAAETHSRASIGKDSTTPMMPMTIVDLFGNTVNVMPEGPAKNAAADPDEEYIKCLRSCVTNSTSTNGLVIERMISHFMSARVDYLCDVILPQCDKNTLILAHHTEYINYFSEIVKQRYPDKHVVVITGSVSAKKRSAIKQLLKENNDCILIASYGVMSTGITLANLCYGVLFESFKSNVINMQSLGRGLGLSELKDKYRLFDVIDVFDKNIIGQYILGQGKAKIKIYKENEYNFKIIDSKI